ncbi:MAG: hypothetical protein J6U86_02050 [Clostridia bacterium]|nr:hypothetical protein [Clostridia bacterium]
MNNDNKKISAEHDDGTYIVKRSKKSNIFAFIVCVLIAFVMWAYAEATENKQSGDVQSETTAVSESV